MSSSEPIDDRSSEVAGVCIFFLILSTICIGLRCYCRIRVVKNFGPDDWLAVFAWVLFAFYSGFCLAGTRYGTGRHMQDIPPQDISIGLKWWWACEPVYVLSNMALKLSIGVFLLRICIEPLQKYTIWAVLIVTEVFGTAFFFLFIFQCLPSKYFWEQFAGTGAQGTCINMKILVDATYVYSAISCWGDWTFSIIPVFIIRKLQMNKRTKWVVVGILALCGIASTATIIRIPYVKNLANIADFLYSTTDIAIWSTAETGIGISAASIATLRPLFQTYFGRSGTGTRSRSNGPYSGGAGGVSGHRRTRSGTGAGNSGFVRSPGFKNTTVGEEFGLRSNFGEHGGVTTVIESSMGESGRRGSDSGEMDLERGIGYTRKGNGAWNTSESRLADDTSSEVELEPPVSSGDGGGDSGTNSGKSGCRWTYSRRAAKDEAKAAGGGRGIEVNRTVVQSTTSSKEKATARGL